MKKLLLSLLTLAVLNGLNAQSNYLKEFKQKWTGARSYTFKVAEAMPEENYDYKPSEEQMSFQEQLIHMVGNIRWLSTSYLGVKRIEVDLKKTDYTKQEVLNILKEAFDKTDQALEKLTLEALEEEVSFFAGPMSKRQILTLLNDHLTHHRGQLVVYLRLNGVPPPSYRGW